MLPSILLIASLLLIITLSALIAKEIHLHTKKMMTLRKKIAQWEHQPIPKSRLKIRLEELKGFKEELIANTIDSWFEGSDKLTRPEHNIDLSPYMAGLKDNEGRNLVFKIVIFLSALLGGVLIGDTIQSLFPLFTAMGCMWILQIMRTHANHNNAQLANQLQAWVTCIGFPKTRNGTLFEENANDGSLKSALAPVLNTLVELSTENSKQTKAFIDANSEAQVEGIKKLITQVQENLETAIGNSINSSVEKFAHSIEAQEATLLKWQDSVNEVANMLEKMQGSASGLNQATVELSRSAEPIAEAASGMQQVSDRLKQTLGLFESAATTYSQANTAMQQSHTALQRGTETYLEAGATVRTLLSELKETHTLASQKIASGVDDAILNSMKEAGSQLSALHEAQGKSLSQWKVATENLEGVVQSIQDSTVEMSNVATALKESTEPTVAASTAFLEAAHTLGETMPQISMAAEAHEHARQAMESTASMLAESNKGYTHSTELLKETLNGFQAAQAQTMAKVQENLEQYTSKALQSAAKAIQETTTHFETQSQSATEFLREASVQLNALQNEQGQSLAQWRMAAENLEGVVLNIQLSTSEMSNAASALKESTEPTVAASTAFLEAAQSLGETMPQISLAAEAHEHARQAMESTASMLAESNKGYTHSTALLQETLNGFQAAQAQTMATVQDNLEQYTSKALQSAAKAFEETTNHFQNASQTAADSFKNHVFDSCEALNQVTTHLQEITTTGIKDLQTSLVMSQKTFTEGFEQSTQTQLSHMNATAENLQSTFAQFSNEIQILSTQQNKQSGVWNAAIENLNVVLLSLGETTSSLTELSQHYEQMVSKTLAASSNFQKASETLTATFPNIEETATAYNSFNSSLTSAAQALENSGQTYGETEVRMSHLLEQVRESMKLQLKSNAHIARTLDSAATTVQSFSPLAEQLQHASAHVLEISTQTANAVERIREVTNAQQGSVEQMAHMSQNVLHTLGEQADGLSIFTNQLQALHHTLTAGVDAFSTALPNSVDQTLVRFDVALGEGVARLGSAVERLREAMDDLIERIESMADSRRRK